MKRPYKFMYEGVEIKVVEVEKPLIDGTDRTYNTASVISQNGGIIPVKINSNESFKIIAEKTIVLLNDFKKRGCDVINELTKPIRL